MCCQVCGFFFLSCCCANPKREWFTSGCLFFCHYTFAFIWVISSSRTPSVKLHRLKPLLRTRLVPVWAGVKLGHQRPHFHWKMHELGRKSSLAFRFKHALTELLVIKSKQNTVLHVNWANVIWKLPIQGVPRILKSAWCGRAIWPVWEELFPIPKSCTPFPILKETLRVSTGLGWGS